MAILITGGAGYIGSVTAQLLREHGKEVVVLDDLSRGHRQAVAPDLPFYQGRVGDRELVKRICTERQIEACVHFAAFAYVGESMDQPAVYFENNVAEGIALLDALLACEVKQLVFSSSCATYSEPEKGARQHSDMALIAETHPQNPASPYGWTKLIMERILESYDRAYGLKFAALRYFNAAGATVERGEDHVPELHLLPKILFVAQGRAPELKIFGDDYPTPDGTCVRDYIHVADLAEAHILALNYLRAGGASERLNLGTGQGYSVLECLETAREITGRDIAAVREPRRPGDASYLVADATKARKVLSWKPQYPELAEILHSAWNWRQAHPDGYGD